MSEQGHNQQRANALFVAMCVGAIAFAVAFVFPMFTQQPVAWYYPLERRWAYEVKPTGLAIDFFGRTLLGIVAWCVSVVATMFVMRRVSNLSAQARSLLLAWTITAVVFVMFYFSWTLYHRVPTPEPIPAWYEPR